MYRWGEEGTPLANCKGPRAWQTEVFLELAEFIEKNKEAKRLGKPLQVFKLAIASARGIGKTALVAWITYWFLSTRIGCTVVISANSDDQCKTTSFAEIRRWHSLAKNAHFFEANIAEALLAGGCSPWQAEPVAKTLVDINTKAEEAKNNQSEKDFSRLRAELGRNLEPTFQNIAALAKHFDLGDAQLHAFLYSGDDVVKSVKKVANMASALMEGASFAVSKKEDVGSLGKIRSRMSKISKKLAEGDEKARAEFKSLCEQEAQLIAKY